MAAKAHATWNSLQNDKFKGLLKAKWDKIKDTDMDDVTTEATLVTAVAKAYEISEEKAFAEVEDWLKEQPAPSAAHEAPKAAPKATAPAKKWEPSK
jgi:hypothetical protein